MDASGQEKSNDQQPEGKPIGMEEKKIESQEAEGVMEQSTEEDNNAPATTTEEIIGKAQEEDASSVTL